MLLEPRFSYGCDIYSSTSQFKTQPYRQISQMDLIYIHQYPCLKLSLIGSLLYISQQFFQNGRKGLYWNKPRIGDQPNTKFSLLVEGIQTQPPLGLSRHYTMVAHFRASPKVNGHRDPITVHCATPRLVTTRYLSVPGRPHSSPKAIISFT